MKRNSFSLIEILIAIVIVGVLATVAVVIFGSNYSSQRRCTSNLRTIANAIEKYREDKGDYPPDNITLKNELTKPPDRYISDEGIFQCPLDPTGNDSYSDYYAKPNDYSSMSQFLIGCPRHDDGKVALNVFFQGQLFKQDTVEIQGKKAGDEIAAGETITLPDGSKIAVNEGSVKILQIVSWHNNRYIFTLKIDEAFTTVMDIKTIPGSQCTVIAPSAVAGVAGTTFRTKTWRSTEQGQQQLFTKIGVREGVVTMSNPKGTVDIKANCVYEAERTPSRNYEHKKPKYRPPQKIDNPQDDDFPPADF